MNRAICYLRENEDYARRKEKITGIIYFDQLKNGGPTKITGFIIGLSPGKHGFHIHKYGNLTRDFKELGPHFNPHKCDHGGLNSPIRHIGDLGNLESTCKDTAIEINIESNVITLIGENSILGRSVCIKEEEDDLGCTNNPSSKLNGNCATRICAGVIGINNNQLYARYS